ncbi:hypothetical protein VZO05_01280 [Aggregatilineales bacterium SYSU G02658]
MTNPQTEFFPQCENCDFFNAAGTLYERCRRHRFIMPEVNWQIVCRDWMTGGETVDFSALQPETLHYYAAGSDAVKHAPLRRFADLNRMLISVRLRQDEQYGWVIYVGGERSHYFPAPGEDVNVLISRRNCKFQIANPPRHLATEMIAQKGAWREVTHKKQAFMLYSREHHQLIYSWLRSFMDIEAYVAKSFAPNIFAFLEVVGNNTDYVLYADTLVYHPYLLR